MFNNDGKGELVTTYAGTPQDIIHALCEEFTNAFHRAGLQPTGVHLVALLYLVVSTIRTGTENPNPTTGKMPSFKLLLMILTKVLAGGDYSKEETEHFTKEFTELVQSLGGHVIPSQPFHKETSFIAPPSKEVH